MTLYMAELAVQSLERSIAFYQKTLHGELVLHDAARHFALLQFPISGRLALKQKEPNPGGVRLHWEVSDLTPWVENRPIHTSHEGYRCVQLHDPDGYDITIFQWIPLSGSTDTDNRKC